MLVHQVFAPGLIRTAKFLDFVDRAFGSQKEQYPEIEPILDWMEESVKNEKQAIFLCVDEAMDYTALMVMDAFRGPWNQQSGWVLFIYSEDRESLRAVLSAASDWGRSNGHSSCQAINQSVFHDDVYIRAMGYPGKVVGSFIRFELEKEN